MRRFGVLVAVAAVVVGCGGGSSSSSDNSAGAAPKELTIDQQNFTEVTVAWDDVTGAEGYHLYYSSDPDFDSDHFATYPHGTWVQDVTSPHSLEMPEAGPNYYFVVTAVDGDGHESFPFLPRVQQTQFAIYDGSGEAVDRYGYIWKRCAEGQTWVASSASCQGSPTVFSAEELEEQFSAFEHPEWHLPYSFQARFSCPSYRNGNDDGSSHCFERVFPDSAVPGDFEERYTFINEVTNEHCGRWLNEDARYWMPCEKPGLVMLISGDEEGEG